MTFSLEARGRNDGAAGGERNKREARVTRSWIRLYINDIVYH